MPNLYMDPELIKTLDAIRQTLAALDARVAMLEAGRVAGVPADAVVDAARVPADAGSPELLASEHSGSVATGRPPAAAPTDRLDPDVILAISAAVAAYLGERAHVRQIRLISSQAWGQQGRVTVQASHSLHR